jgi:phenolic acid decarboxylase
MDHLILMREGRNIYQGDPKNVISYFQSIGFEPKTQFMNPADFMIKIAVFP